MSLKNVCLSILMLFLFLSTSLLAEENSIKKELDVVGIQKSIDKQKWIEKEELSTFTSTENLKNSFIRKMLNGIVSFIKKVSAEGLIGAIAALFIAMLIFFASPAILPILFLLITLNDLYYLNPLGIIGLIFDYYVISFKLLCSMFGWYI